MIGRAALEDVLWESAKDVLFCSKEAFFRSLDGWQIKPVEIDGTLAVITLQKGATFHFHSTKSGKRITRAMICDFLAPVIAEFGFAETHTPHGDDRQQRFNHLIGFERVGEDAFDVIYRIDHVPGA